MIFLTFRDRKYEYERTLKVPLHLTFRQQSTKSSPTSAHTVEPTKKERDDEYGRKDSDEHRMIADSFRTTDPA